MEGVYERLENNKQEEVFNEYLDFLLLDESDLQVALLDVGTGNGDFIKYVRNVIGNKSAYGVESEPNKVEPDTDGIFLADGLKLPFDDETFELVIAKKYLPMFLDENPIEPLIEMLRVVKPGGGRMVASILTPDEEDEKAKLESKPNNKNWHIRRQKGAEQFMDYLKELQKDGLSVSMSQNSMGNTILTIRK